MKFLKVKNRMPTSFHFAFCTISSCQCDVCMEWRSCETIPIANWPGWTFGSLTVDGFSERVDRFCPRWDCVGAVFFDYMPSTVAKDHFFDYDEGKDYVFANGKAEMSFTHELPDVTASNCQTGNGLEVAMIAGRLALVCVGAPDVGIIGDIMSFFS